MGSSDPWYNSFLDGGIEIRAARGIYDNTIGVLIKNNFSYDIWVKVKMVSANGSKSGYYYQMVSANSWSSNGIYYNTTPGISNTDGFGDITLVLLLTQDENGRDHFNPFLPRDVPDGFKNRTW